MVLFGLDISHHQGERPQSWFHQVRASGCEYMIMKATESSGFVDAQFAENLEKARNAGLLVAAYHYQRAGVSAAAQVDNVRRTVPLTYLPRWYWLQIGQPDLTGLPPLWSSRYPDNAQGSILDEFADVPAHYWNGYGGLGVALLQFSSSGRVAGYAPLDLNAFRGTRQEFAALLGGDAVPEVPSVSITQESTVEIVPNDGTPQSKTTVVPSWAKEVVVSRGYEGFNLLNCKQFGPTPAEPPPATATLAEMAGAQWCDPARPFVQKVAPGALTVEVTVEMPGNAANTGVVGFR